MSDSKPTRVPFNADLLAVLATRQISATLAIQAYRYDRGAAKARFVRLSDKEPRKLDSFGESDLTDLISLAKAGGESAGALAATLADIHKANAAPASQGADPAALAAAEAARKAAEDKATAESARADALARDLAEARAWLARLASPGIPAPVAVVPPAPVPAPVKVAPTPVPTAPKARVNAPANASGLAVPASVRAALATVLAPGQSV